MEVAEEDAGGGAARQSRRSQGLPPEEHKDLEEVIREARKAKAAKRKAAQEEKERSSAEASRSRPFKTRTKCPRTATLKVGQPGRRPLRASPFRMNPPRRRRETPPRKYPRRRIEFRTLPHRIKMWNRWKTSPQSRMSRR
jgi:hypothetical protein